MPTKTITITLEAYERLKREKREGESFSDVIIRLTEKRRDLLEFERRGKICLNLPVNGRILERKSRR